MVDRRYPQAANSCLPGGGVKRGLAIVLGPTREACEEILRSCASVDRAREAAEQGLKDSENP
jgi:hypothetical protein